MPIALLALLSGVPALIYEVVWTREAALLVGSQVEAISVVIVAFFGGLALGARGLGPLADRVASPLRLYGMLEIAAAGLAALSLPALRVLGGRAAAAGGTSLVLAATCALILPVTFLLGATLPALLRSAVRAPGVSARLAGWIVGANTAGSVVGVGMAVLLIPKIGLRSTALGAVCAAATIGGVAFVLGRTASPPADRDARAAGPAARVALAAAGAAGVTTLGYEILATRLAMLQLGSSLHAWGLVLACFLVGLATGNAALARRASRTLAPERDLGWIEIGAAAALASGLLALRPALASPAAGLVPGALCRVIAGCLAPAFLMGGAFPFLVRLGVREERIGASFGAVSAVNTAGGILGALLAPFALLPALGPMRGALVCAGLNALLGVFFLSRGGIGARRIVLRLGLAASCALPPAVLVLAIGSPPRPRIIYVDHGAQATAVVTQLGGRRDLIVDGDPEASTAGNARRTEELLAVLPILLHPDPRSFLELGLGSGITLGTAARFPLEHIACMEISPSVIRAARYFVPDNGDVTRRPGVRIVRGDVRSLLPRHRDRHDVVAANTLHPWSLGATGLYSLEYFGRIARALRPGGIAAQWLPAEQIGAESLILILRTFFEVFPEGGVWWAARSLIAIGSDAQLELGAASAERVERRLRAAGIAPGGLRIADASELEARWLADASSVRAALGPGAVLVDDRPLLEELAARRRSTLREAELFSVLLRVAREGVRRGSGTSAVLFWLESLEARAIGETARAKARETLAEAAGATWVRRARAERTAQEGLTELSEDRLDVAARYFGEALADDPSQRDARFGLAEIALREEGTREASAELRRLLDAHPGDAEAWNQLGVVLHKQGDLQGAVDAFEAALRANPFFPEALANAGMLEARRGDLESARARLERLRAISPLGALEEERALARVLGGR
jgi:spermidine synthase